MTDVFLPTSADQPRPEDDEADRIAAAALAAFDSCGYVETALDDIARLAGVPIDTLLDHFASKDEIFRDVVRSTLLGSLSAREDAAVPAEEPSAADAVRGFARTYWTTMSRPDLAIVVRLIVSELPRFPELAVLHATEALERFARALERIIARGIARGEMRPVDARAAARTILATLAAHAVWCAYPSIYGALTGTDRDRAISDTIEILIHALMPSVADPS